MKDKMRCARCGKTFKPARSSQTMCDQCEKQERAARAAAKATSATANHPSASVTQPVRIVGPAANLLDPTAPSARVGAPPPDSGLYGAAAIREEQRREQQRREEQRREEQRRAEERAREEQRIRERAQARPASRPTDDRRGRPEHAAHSGAQAPNRSVRPGAPRGERPAIPAPRQPKAPRSLVPQFEMTDELRATIEARYLELAQPIEFDGIRTRIAAELGVPKSHVKHVVAELRTRMQLPSWWELQSYSGAETDLERIRMAYLPHLPVPDVGIHKTLAETLSLDPRTVYQGIRRIRAEMRLPQYNAPETHGDIPLNLSRANGGASAEVGATGDTSAEPLAEQTAQAIGSAASAPSDTTPGAENVTPE
ncbi:MAG TPA: hypothetical protein VE338_13255 [Ktedonobacterales bacterium]|jgi:hypothetical protein|nr:hypothetical protein [Ktedonobacterales bacterium]